MFACDTGEDTGDVVDAADVVDEFAAGYRKIILTNPDDIPHPKRKAVE